MQNWITRELKNGSETTENFIQMILVLHTSKSENE